MKQVMLAGKGSVSVFDVPVPLKREGSVLVRTHYSLISTGTEGAAVTKRDGVLGVVEKATSSKARLEQVWQMSRSQGLLHTAEAVRNKLEDYSPLGYSAAGTVVEVSDDSSPFSVGDRVACMGAGFANHAEYNTVPYNLLAPVPDSVPLSAASFGALACIAQQGVRILECSPGEKVVVLGLGLIGTLAALQCDAMGYEVLGLDTNQARCEEFSLISGLRAAVVGTGAAREAVSDWTDGYGADGVVVCASTSSDSAIDLACDLSRIRGAVSVVGDVSLNLKREKLYRKELRVQLSCSYGVGRYDAEFELQGRDYPLPYVRWTQKRNLEFFLAQLRLKKFSLDKLASSIVPIAEADAAFAQIKLGDPKVFAVVLDYGAGEAISQSTEDAAPARVVVNKSVSTPSSGKLRIALVGLGGFAKSSHFPNLLKLKKSVAITALASASGANAGVLASKHGIGLATSEYKRAIESPEVDAVVISTRHSTHYNIARAALEAGKHVFVEKPMTLTEEEGQELVDLAERNSLVVRVGFNRRFSPYIRALRDYVGSSGKRIFHQRVSIGAEQLSHWSNDKDEGGRFLGEGVHFIDLANWFMGAYPDELSAQYLGEADASNPNLVLSMSYPDGSLASLVYTSCGDPGIGKEYFEAFGNGKSVRCDNFVKLEGFGGKKIVLGRAGRSDKGLALEIQEFVDSVRSPVKESVSEPVRRPVGATALDGLWATKIALKSIESAQQGTKLLLAGHSATRGASRVNSG